MSECIAMTSRTTTTTTTTTTRIRRAYVDAPWRRTPVVVGHSARRAVVRGSWFVTRDVDASARRAAYRNIFARRARARARTRRRRRRCDESAHASAEMASSVRGARNRAHRTTRRERRTTRSHRRTHARARSHRASGEIARDGARASGVARRWSSGDEAIAISDYRDYSAGRRRTRCRDAMRSWN